MATGGTSGSQGPALPSLSVRNWKQPKVQVAFFKRSSPTAPSSPISPVLLLCPPSVFLWLIIFYPFLPIILFTYQSFTYHCQHLTIYAILWSSDFFLFSPSPFLTARFNPLFQKKGRCCTFLLIITNSSTSLLLLTLLPSSSSSSFPILALLSHDSSLMTFLGLYLSLTSLPSNHDLTNSHSHIDAHLITFDDLCSFTLIYPAAVDCSLIHLIDCDDGICSLQMMVRCSLHLTG